MKPVGTLLAVRPKLAIATLLYGFVCAASAADYPDAMQFEVFQPCRGSASFCAPRILARGVIDDGASERLKAVLESTPFRTTVALDSPGGSLKEGLEIGLVIRLGGHDTVVAREYSEELVPEGGFTGFRIVAGDAGCYSACAYAFMGGVSRTLEEGGRLGVHQFAGMDDDSGESAAQAMTAVLSQYVTAMGINRDVLDLAGLTGSDEMSVVSRNDAIEYNLDNQHPLLAEWRLEALDSGEIAAKVDQQQAGSDRITRILISRSEERPDMFFFAVGNGVPGNISNETMRQVAMALDAKASFCIDFDTCVPALTLRPWSYSAENKTISALFAVDAGDFLALFPQSGEFTFNSGFPEVYSHLRPDVELGRNGLRNTLMALLR